MSTAAVPIVQPRASRLTAYAFAFAFLASTAGFFSIAVSHVCLGVALVVLLLSRTRLAAPPAIWPLAAFAGLTVVSMLASDDPASGWPQIKKFFVFSMLVVVYSLFRSADQARRLLEAWFVAGLVVAVVSYFQFAAKWSEARALGADFNTFYATQRITGFFSHWMTFSQTGLLIFVALVCYLLFSRSVRDGRLVWFFVALLIGAALILSYTRSVWLALAMLAGYWMLNWKPKLLWALPALALAAYSLAPDSIRLRVRSIGDTSANQARLIMWRTGGRMIAARPWTGVGPERVGPLFDEYLPEDVSELPPAYYSHLHSIYVHYAAERGLPALAALLWLLLKVLWDHFRALRRLPPGRGDERFLLHTAIAATLAVMTVGAFDLTLGDSEVLAAYLSIVALGYRAVRRVNRVGACASAG